MNNELKHQYLNSSENWNKYSSVRNSEETYELSLNKTKEFSNAKLNWSLISLIPIFNHSFLKDITDDEKKYITGIHILDFVQKTKKFEIDYVNRVASKISLSKYKFNFPERIKLDALKIYTDEAYHAYFTKKIEQQIKEYYSINNEFDKYVSPFFTKVDVFLNSVGKKEKDLIELALIIIAENTILSDLSSTMKNLVYEPLINMFKDHISDEAFHAKFFTQVFIIIWNQLNQDEKNSMNQFLLDAIELLSAPRIDNFYFSLRRIGLPINKINKIIEETYTNDLKNINTDKRYNHLLKVFSKVYDFKFKKNII